MTRLPRARRSVVALLCGFVSLVAACGGGSEDEARELQKRSIVSDPEPLSAALIKTRDLRRYTPDSVERAFLSYWSTLQFEGWRTAVRFYEPGLRDYIGDDRLLRALAGQVGVFQSNRPIISSVARVNGDLLLKYLLRDTSTNETPRSLAWRRIGGNWRVVYDGFLDDALGEAGQLEVQTRIDPTAQKPSTEALRAGARARRLQSQYAADRQGQ